MPGAIFFFDREMHDPKLATVQCHWKHKYR